MSDKSTPQTAAVGRDVDNTLTPPPASFLVRINIDPNDSVYSDDKFKLFSTDGAYRQTKTVQHDTKPGDEYLDLLYTDLIPDLKYSLEVDPGKEGSAFLLFQEVLYADLNTVSPCAEEPTFEEDQTVDPSSEEDDSV